MPGEAQELQEREYVLRRSTFSGYWHGYVVGGMGTATQRTPSGVIDALDDLERHKDSFIAEAAEWVEGR